MYAIIETGGKQYRVAQGDVIRIERLGGAETDQQVRFERVLAVGSGEDLKVGSPLVDGASVMGRVLGHHRDKKILVFKYRPKKRWRRRRGHRQWFTRVQIEAIEG